MKLFESFLESDLPSFEPDGKVGLLATVNDEGLPHISLITAMRAPDLSSLVFGQFCEGLGKDYAERNKKTGFLIMSLDKILWRGRARWRAKSRSGAEHEIFNTKPMWRYNAYFGIHTVHYLDLEGTTRAEKLPMGKIAGGVVKAALTKGRHRSDSPGEVLNSWTRAFISKTGNLKFFAYVEDDGFPVIIPCLSAVTVDAASVLIPGSEYRSEIAAVPDGAAVSLFTMSLDMEDVLVRGTFSRSGRGGVITVDWVYNSMPPVAKQIYPPAPSNSKVGEFV